MKAFLGIDPVPHDDEGRAPRRVPEQIRQGDHQQSEQLSPRRRDPRDEAIIGARFTLLDRELRRSERGTWQASKFRQRLLYQFRKQQHLSQLTSLRRRSLVDAVSDRLSCYGIVLSERLGRI